MDKSIDQSRNERNFIVEINRQIDSDPEVKKLYLTNSRFHFFVCLVNCTGFNERYIADEIIQLTKLLNESNSKLGKYVLRFGSELLK